MLVIHSKNKYYTILCFKIYIKHILPIIIDFFQMNTSLGNKGYTLLKSELVPVVQKYLDHVVRGQTGVGQDMV